MPFLVELNQRLQQRHRLHDPHGAGRPDLRGDAWRRRSARAATPAGCWCRSCGTSASRRASCPGYLVQLDGRRESRSTARRGRPPTSPICTPGPRSTCRAPAGSASIRPRACSPARATSRSPARPTRRAPPRSPALADRDAASSSHSPTRCSASTKTRASPSRTPTSSGRRSTRSATRSTRICEAHDVRLTMGGEPTFVSIDDMDGAEWNTAALGPTKRRLAGALLQRLQQRFAPGGAAALRPGQVVPGRAAAALGAVVLLAPDGVPVWRDRSAARRRVAASAAIGREHAARFIGALAHRLGLAGELALPGYEDALYYLWKEGTLPANVDPLQRRSERSARAPPARRAARSAVSARSPATRCRLQWLEHPTDGGRWQTSPLDLPPRSHVPGARRLADGLPPAARFPALGAARGARAARPSTRSSRRDRRCGRHLTARSTQRYSELGWEPARSRDGTREQVRRSPRRTSARRRAHRPVRRAARRPPLRLPAAADAPRALPRPGRRASKRPPPSCACRW